MFRVEQVLMVCPILVGMVFFAVHSKTVQNNTRVKSISPEKQQQQSKRKEFASELRHDSESQRRMWHISFEGYSPSALPTSAVKKALAAEHKRFDQTIKKAKSKRRRHSSTKTPRQSKVNSENFVWGLQSAVCKSPPIPQHCATTIEQDEIVRFKSWWKLWNHSEKSDSQGSLDGDKNWNAVSARRRQSATAA
jgi:hypothetical protein